MSQADLTHKDFIVKMMKESSSPSVTDLGGAYSLISQRIKELKELLSPIEKTLLDIAPRNEILYIDKEKKTKVIIKEGKQKYYLNPIQVVKDTSLDNFLKMVSVT